jgi:hypothetical protein
VEGNRRTAGLPNPCPLDLQNHCTFLLGSLPLRLRQATAPSGPDPHTAGCLPFSYTGLQPSDPHHAGISAPWPCRWMHDHWVLRHPVSPHPSPEPVSQLTGIPAHPPSPLSSGPAEPQLRVGQPDPHPLGLPPPIRPCQSPALCGTLEPHPTGTGTTLV